MATATFNDAAEITHIQRRAQEFIDAHADDDSDGCWLWTGAPGSGGYGQARASVNGVSRQGMAHRLIYVLMVGPVSADLTLDHLCRVLMCCRPSHLEPVTQAENNRRKTALQTHCRRGHALVVGNLIPSNLKRGSRACLTCHRQLSRERRAERRAS